MNLKITSFHEKVNFHLDDFYCGLFIAYVTMLCTLK